MLHKTYSLTFSQRTKKATNNEAHNDDVNSDDGDCDKEFGLLF